MPLSPEQFNAAVAEHYDLLFAMAIGYTHNKHDAEDLVQEALCSAWKSRECFKWGIGSGARGWLLTIVRHRAIDKWRKPKLPMEPAIADVHCFDCDPSHNEYTSEVQCALDSLPESMRNTALLVCVDGWTHQEVADKLSIPLGTVLSRVYRAKQKMRKYLAP